jgi:hypothetical protein
MLREPVAHVSEPLGEPCELDRLAQGFARRRSGANRDEIENRERSQTISST